jgi:hypothetical protein
LLIIDFGDPLTSQLRLSNGPEINARYARTPS